MTKPSEHDLVVEKKREEAREKLIDSYIQIAIDNSKAYEYGFLNVMGQEVPDPTVVEPPLGYVAQPDIMEQMRNMIRNELSRVAEAQEFETFEDADDFEVDEDPVDYTTPYEMFFDPPPGEPPGPTLPEPPAPPPPPPPAPPGEPSS